jgi:hypothetical protein
MTNLSDIISNDLNSISFDLGNPSFIWKNEEYICVPSGVSDNMDLGMGGLLDIQELVLNVRKSLFTDSIYPKSQDKITYKGIVYRIQNVRQDSTQAFLRLSLTNPNQGINNK